MLTIAKLDSSKQTKGSTMKTIQSSTDIKAAFNEIASHIHANQKTARGEEVAELLLVISSEVYVTLSASISYNAKIEFAMQCDPNSMTQLFQVQ